MSVLSKGIPKQVNEASAESISASKFKHDPDYDYPRGEDTEDLKFLVMVVLVITGGLVGFVAGLFYWVF